MHIKNELTPSGYIRLIETFNEVFTDPDSAVKLASLLRMIILNYQRLRKLMTLNAPHGVIARDKHLLNGRIEALRDFFMSNEWCGEAQKILEEQAFLEKQKELGVKSKHLFEATPEEIQREYGEEQEVTE